MTGSTTRADMLLSEQFTDDGRGGWVDRKSQIGPAIAVTFQEFAAFGAGYAKARQWSMRARSIGTFVIIFLMALLVDPKNPNSNIILFSCIAAMVIALVSCMNYAWYAPQRVLAGRPELAPALSRDLARKVRYARLTWGRLAWGGLVAVIYGARVAAFGDNLIGWNILLLAGFVLLLGFLSWQVWQKVLIDRV